jgi:hypothetical protein
VGEATVVVRLVRTQRNGADVVVEVLTANQSGTLDGLLKPDARHTSDGDPDDELAPDREHHELADDTPCANPTTSAAIPTRRGQARREPGAC